MPKREIDSNTRGALAGLENRSNVDLVVFGHEQDNFGGEEEVGRVTWDEYYKSRERVTETTNINKGLLVLKRCVYALRDSTANNKRRQKMRVPFYDSMLTQLLEPALGGPSRTTILVCASQEPDRARGVSTM